MKNLLDQPVFLKSSRILKKKYYNWVKQSKVARGWNQSYSFGIWLNPLGLLDVLLITISDRIIIMIDVQVQRKVLNTQRWINRQDQHHAICFLLIYCFYLICKKELGLPNELLHPILVYYLLPYHTFRHLCIQYMILINKNC